MCGFRYPDTCLDVVVRRPGQAGRICVNAGSLAAALGCQREEIPVLPQRSDGIPLHSYERLCLVDFAALARQQGVKAIMHPWNGRHTGEVELISTT